MILYVIFTFKFLKYSIQILIYNSKIINKFQILFKSSKNFKLSI